MVQNPNTSTDEHCVETLGRAVRDFMTEHEMKSLYVRSASRFGSSQFVAFKKAN